MISDLTEQLKLLGFTENIPIALLNTSYGSLESFKAYATILQWLVSRLEPGATVPGNINTENDRILFIRSVSEFLVSIRVCMCKYVHNISLVAERVPNLNIHCYRFSSLNRLCINYVGHKSGY